MEFGEVAIVSLPAGRVASYEVTGEAPEQDAIAFVEKWLADKGLRPGADGVRGFGFDCHKERDIPEGCRIYHVYYTVPADVAGDAAVTVKDFPGGAFARLIVTDPFSGDFPTGWYTLLAWTFEHNVRNGLGCTSPDDCYSLFSGEDSPCLEELYQQDGVQYMALYLPLA